MDQRIKIDLKVLRDKAVDSTDRIRVAKTITRALLLQAQTKRRARLKLFTTDVLGVAVVTRSAVSLIATVERFFVSVNETLNA